MGDIQKSMKLSLVYGLSGAVLVPLLYEAYANVSAAVGLWLLAAWAVFVGVKFSALRFREAFVGITCCLAYTGVLGLVCYIIIHPAVSKSLSARSVYFQLSLKEQAYFLLYAALILLCIYVVWAARFGLDKALEKFRRNRDETGKYIDNAFDDNDDEDRL